MRRGELRDLVRAPATAFFAARLQIDAPVEARVGGARFQTFGARATQIATRPLIDPATVRPAAATRDLVSAIGLLGHNTNGRPDAIGRRFLWRPWRVRRFENGRETLTGSKG